LRLTLTTDRSSNAEGPPGPRASGGWGLGAGQVDKTVDYDEDEELDQGQIQDKVRNWNLEMYLSPMRRV